MRRPTRAQLEKQCANFNARYPVGTRVTVGRDAGDVEITATRSKAEVLSGHSAVIWLDGISGCYLLDRITPVANPQASRAERGE